MTPSLLLALLLIIPGHAADLGNALRNKPAPRDYREVIRDIEKLRTAGVKDEAAYTKLADEIVRGIYNF